MARFLVLLTIPFVVHEPAALCQTLRQLAAEIAAAAEESGGSARGKISHAPTRVPGQ